MLFCAGPVLAITPEAREFLEISSKLEPVQCEKRRLRREIVFAEVEKREADAKDLRSRFGKLNNDPQTARLEKRLAVLERRILDSKGVVRNPGDLEAISFQHREAYYRCD